jgi:TM2 domain-containing membrane protein YozV
MLYFYTLAMYVRTIVASIVLKNIIIIVVFCFLNQFSKAGNMHFQCVLVPLEEIRLTDATRDAHNVVHAAEKQRPNPLLQLFRIKQKKNKRLTAAVLAFPFPFGIVGLHRIYLGCAPYVPVVYIASLGGAFGVLPFIDFCALVLDKDIDCYINNQKVFMWVK